MMSPEFTESGSRRPLPELRGVTPVQMRTMLETVSIEAAPPQELFAYVDEDFERFVHTAALIHDVQGECLEIGANPYFITVLLRELTDLQLTLTNFFGPDGETECSQQVSYQSIGASTPTDHRFDYLKLNVEAERFPFADESFDVVLFCEVIEHLLLDPVAALEEIWRVLKPGGQLVVTTPNVARLENVARLVAGANIYDPYSGYGPYGRHNREYTRHELCRLLTFCGFEPSNHFTLDVHPHRTAGFFDPARLEPVLGWRSPDLGQYLFVRATKSTAPSGNRPSFLFRSLPGSAIVAYE